MAYSSSGDIIDVKTHKIVGQMKDEYGRTMYSEKLLDITFDNGHAQRVSNQFANSFGDYQTAEQIGRWSARHADAGQRTDYADWSKRRQQRMSKLAIRLSAGLLAPALFAAAWAVGVSQLSSQERETRSLQIVCAKCHNLQIVMDTPKSYDAWQETVQKMVNLGARGTDEQYDDIMDYLHRTITTIDVNSADMDELEIVLNASETTAQAIVTRRKTRKFAGLADLKSIAGVDKSIVDAKARMIFFN